jgi:acetyl-CoA acetyltransferase
MTIRDKTAIAGVGVSEFGRFLPDSQLNLGAKAFKAALADSGMARDEVRDPSLDSRALRD